jgi:hypothetical protein
MGLWMEKDEELGIGLSTASGGGGGGGGSAESGLGESWGTIGTWRGLKALGGRVMVSWCGFALAALESGSRHNCCVCKTNIWDGVDTWGKVWWRWRC